MLDSTPVQKAFTQIIELSGRTDKFRLYSYVKNFDELWGLKDGLDTLVSMLNASCIEEILVIWDEVPGGKASNVNTALYLTPIDWAVAFSLAACRMAKGSSHFRITIIDLNSSSSASASAVRFVDQFPCRDIMSMPWVRIVRPILPGNPGNCSEKERRLEEMIVDLLSRNSEDTKFRSIAQTFNDSSHDVELVRSVWRTNLVRTPKTDDNHAIANLLGPLLLSGTVRPASGTAEKSDETPDGTTETSDNVSALRNLLKELGLYPSDLEAEKNQDEESKTRDEELKKSWRGLSARLKSEKIKILLMDDQWRDGWGEAICNLLGIDYVGPGKDTNDKESFVPIGADNGLIVKVSSSPEWLAGVQKKSGQCGKLDNIDSNQRFRLSLDEGDGLLEILCLDLRLFSGNNVRREVDLINDLLSIADNLKDRKLKEPWNLLWNGFGEKELKDISNWAADAKKKGFSIDSRNDPRYHQALTLLPRIIAEIDMSYPVIVFSSTGRREIAKRFESYGNLLADFEKPRFTGLLSIDAVFDAQEKLFKTFERAADFLNARRLCAALPAIPTRPQATTEVSGSWKIELYIDETGTEINTERMVPFRTGTITLGGLLAVYSPSKNPDKFNDFLSSKLNNVIQGKADHEAKKLALRNEANNLVDCILRKESEDSPDFFAMVTLRGHVDSCSEELGFMEFFGVGDNLYRETISTLTEVAIYHLARTQIPLNSEAEYKVVMPTRQIPIDSEAAEKNAELLSSHWGMGIDAPNAIDLNEFKSFAKKIGIDIKDAYPSWKKRIVLFGSDAARPIIQQIAKQYRFSRFRPRAEHGRAYSNNSFTTSNIRNRPLHYLIDAVLDPKGNRDKIEQIQSNGFTGDLNDNLKLLLHACRLNDTGFPGDALSVVASVSGREGTGHRKQASHVLTLSLTDATERITGIEYQQLVSQLRRQDKLEARRSIQDGTIVIKGTQFKVQFVQGGITKEMSIDKSSLRQSVAVGDKVKFYSIHGELPGRWYARLVNESS